MNLSTAALIASLLPAPVLMASPKPMIEALAPPAIPHIYTENGQRRVLYFDGKKVRSDKTWPGPIIIKVSPKKYLIWWKGQIRTKKIMEGGEKTWDNLFNITGPPDPPFDNDGGGPNDDDMDYGPNPPFMPGDIVQSKENPEFGLGEVVKVYKIKDFDGVQFWGVTVDFLVDGDISRIMGKASMFVKAIPPHNTGWTLTALMMALGLFSYVGIFLFFMAKAGFLIEGIFLLSFASVVMVVLWWRIKKL